jgi:hypothetical protein
VRADVLTAVTVKGIVFSDVTSLELEKNLETFRRNVSKFVLLKGLKTQKIILFKTEQFHELHDCNCKLFLVHR